MAQLNTGVAKEIQYALASVVTATPYHIATGYVNSADMGASYAVQGLKMLSGQNQYNIGITEISDGYVYSVPYANIQNLLETVAPSNGLINNDWVYASQLREENEGLRFLCDFYKYLMYSSVYAYVSAIVRNVEMFQNMPVSEVATVVNTLARCLMAYPDMKDNAFITLGNVTKQFNDALNENRAHPQFQAMLQQWITLVRQVYDYLTNNENYVADLQIFGNSYVWNVAIAGVTNQVITYHRNIRYPLYGINFETLKTALTSVNFPFADITIIDMNEGKQAYNISTYGQQGSAIVKQCCQFADSGNGVMLRIMFTPRKVVINA